MQQPPIIPKKLSSILKYLPIVYPNGSNSIMIPTVNNFMIKSTIPI